VDHIKPEIADYIKPEIADYGSLEDLTANLGPGGRDDGGTKEFHTTAPR
jgi:hypothetical protein